MTIDIKNSTDTYLYAYLPYVYESKIKVLDESDIIKQIDVFYEELTKIFNYNNYFYSFIKATKDFEGAIDTFLKKNGNLL